METKCYKDLENSDCYNLWLASWLSIHPFLEYCSPSKWIFLSCWENKQGALHLFAQAVIEKYHRLDVLIENFLILLEARSLRSRCQKFSFFWVLSPWLIDGHLLLVSSCAFPFIHNCVCVSLSLSLFFFFGCTYGIVEVPRPGIKPEPRLQPAPQLGQCQILNPLHHLGTSKSLCLNLLFS